MSFISPVRWGTCGNHFIYINNMECLQWYILVPFSDTDLSVNWSLIYLNRAIFNLKKKSCHFKVSRDDLLKKSMWCNCITCILRRICNSFSNAYPVGIRMTWADSLIMDLKAVIIFIQSIPVLPIFHTNKDPWLLIDL